MKEDNSDGFQIYENGGATACHAFHFLAALYDLGRRDEADKILFPMLDSFEKGSFEGVGANGMSNDWKTWDGTPWGYEGFLTDGYYTLLAVLVRDGQLKPMPAPSVRGGEKGDRSNLCEAPSGPFRQIGPVPFSLSCGFARSAEASPSELACRSTDRASDRRAARPVSQRCCRRSFALAPARPPKSRSTRSLPRIGRRRIRSATSACPAGAGPTGGDRG